MKKKRLLIVFTILTLLVAMPVVSYADMVYVDPFTGENLTGDMSQVQNYTVSYDCIYNAPNDLYRYTLPNMADYEIQSNVARGMVTQKPVVINVPTGVTPFLYMDGILLEGVDYSNITALGSYTLSVKVNGQEVSNVLNFTICGQYCGYVYNIQLPDGFSFTQVYYNGQPKSTSSNYLDLTEEGDYAFTYVCNASQKSYSVKTIVDHTAPTLKLSELNEKNVARGPVSIADLEEGAYIAVYLNDKLVENLGDTLTGTGNYLVVVTDPAGNTTNYQFEIQMYFDLNSWILIFLVILIIAGVTVYIIFNRKHLRVR